MHFEDWQLQVLRSAFVGFAVAVLSVGTSWAKRAASRLAQRRTLCRRRASAETKHGDRSGKPS